jgi:hypothetical protein
MAVTMITIIDADAFMMGAGFQLGRDSGDFMQSEKVR